MTARERRDEWNRLTELADRFDRKGKASLTANELLEYTSLYRRAVSDLARARTRKAHLETIDFLNHLLGRVHLQIYTTRSSRGDAIKEYFLRGFPQAIRRNAKWVTASALFLLLPAAAAWLAVEAHPPLARVFTPPGYLDHLDEAFGADFGSEGRSAGEAALGTTFYIVNNVQVSFFAFATGMLFGLGSLYILAMNGAILGGVAAAVRQNGVTENFWSFVAPHGGIELTAIVVSGAAGLMIGAALINPGPHTRGRALIEAGREAGRMLFGMIAMLALAAVIEASISPSTLPNVSKVALGLANMAGVIVYFTLAGRGNRSGVKPAAILDS
jgi:uncharacterized membrane protein SpoIIM required for sporulation